MQNNTERYHKFININKTEKIMNNPNKVYDISGKGDMDIQQKGSFDADANLTGQFAQMNMASIATPKGQVMMTAPAQGEEEESNEEELKEHLASLFANADLSEDFIEKAKTIFVAAVNEKANQMSTRINEAYSKEYGNALSETVSALTGKIDDYLSYVVEEWINENKLQVERGIKVELAENFIFGLKKLFENNFIDVPNEKYDVLDELYTQIETKDEELNKSISENIFLKKKLLESTAVTIFAKETQGLAQTQVEKLANLAEGMEFQDPEQFRNKLQILKESYFGKSNIQSQSAPVTMPRVERKIDILDTSTEPEMINEGMDIYRKAISRHLKK
jgi:hypothetical protein